MLPTTQKTATTTDNLRYAKKFAIEKKGDITIVRVFSPWPNAENDFTYALIPREKAATITLEKDVYDAVVLTPIERVVVTSTTHIPTLEMLGVEHKLVGFPQTNYISSEKTRALIDSGKVKDVGQNEQINIELLIDLEPELVIGFSINNSNPTYKTIQKANIPVVYNGDWTEETPLGRAEWIHFFAPFFNKEAKATEVFQEIEKNYLNAKKLAQNATSQPTILAGSMYKDIWYLPAGESFQAQYLKDANANYLWADSEGTGSLSLSIESVLDKAADADIWIGPGSFKTYEAMKESSRFYAEFAPFKNKKIFSTANTVGKTGGTMYYELAPTRPDIVLKDIIKAIHPEILPDYQPFFFKPLL
ncbi:MAG: ABC transporter substrate-binding protein [Bacteroidota bacterium]